MRYIESPDIYRPRNGDRSIFLAGGISGCPEWQQDMVRLLEDTDLVVFNPRRKDFPADTPAAAEAQIRWEVDHLRLAQEVLFWFPCETLCPITLYELGSWSMTDKTLYVGMHPDYVKRFDLEIQLKLVRPLLEITYSLTDLAAQVRQAHEHRDLPEVGLQTIPLRGLR